ncbi:hypothetical protein H257_02231 [Aphanomyces astaci]|uniref:Uncharacterized protein n=1 Tax=Aphanomyces astaci TaxID=112090 RepID=W4H5K1_APHAT|nr:hypothetical protein H257_02231 [Aphanomyces astaci]ETV87285.1 hypothetical protein H257_02231 [Aphanomyces astaci]RQM26411.1 hypothetical protein B5M09_005179 [Aphanomyces astaci]|eukprot:XP_009824084.1 hypothetical protein H257_02231 [Aphanomyces astaci]
MSSSDPTTTTTEQPTVQKRQVSKVIFDQAQGRSATEEFDKEFQKYNTKHNAVSATALTLARSELSKANALLWQDDKLTKLGQPGSLTATEREHYEARVKQLEAAIDTYHQSISTSNYTRAVLSFAGLVVFVLLLILLNQKVPMF